MGAILPPVVSKHRGTRTGRRTALVLLSLVVLGTMSLLGAARAGAAFPTPIRHVVVIYEENHSFDETLGYWCNTFTPARCNGFTGAVHLKDGSVVTMTESP